MARFLPSSLARDLPASIVVVLVALPLCMGIAVASGVPAEKGLVTGIIGGLVVGLLAGSPLQVSGPAAGLAVIVFQLVQDFGLAMLGPILVLAGLLQLGAGVLRLGKWFRAISPAVVHGMLAGIGVLIVAAQLQVLFGRTPLPDGLQNLAAIPAALLGLLPLQWSSATAAVLAGGATILAMVLWERLRPRSLRLIPGALVGVVAGTALAVALSLPVQRVDVPDAILASISVPTMADLSRLGESGILAAALVIAVIASAETLLSAAAVDRMHDGVRTNYDRELSAQGVGNLLCGLAGALPMTGVIVRSSANVQAGAVTRLSTILHGAWILAAVALLPWLLREVPMASLAGVLVVTGWRLVSLKHVRELLQRHGVLPAAIWAATVVMVVATDLLTGVLVGLALSLLEVLPHLRRMPLRIKRRDLPSGEAELRLEGAATFLQLPALLRALEALPPGATVRLDAGGLAQIDHTSMEMLADWAERRAARGRTAGATGPAARPASGRGAPGLRLSPPLDQLLQPVRDLLLQERLGPHRAAAMQQLDLGLRSAGDEGEGDAALLEHVGGGIDLGAAEPDVEECGVQPLRAGDPDRLAQRADRADHLEPADAAMVSKHRRDPGVVLDDQDAGRGLTALHVTSTRLWLFISINSR